MKNITYILTILALSANVSSAQTPADNAYSGSPDYTTAIGLRGGFTSGLTVKQFVTDQTALEGILGIWPYSLSATGLVEFYRTTGINGLNWYYGFGGHLAFETGRIYNSGRTNGRRSDRDSRYEDSSLGFGVDGILGMEYKILPLPFAISIDIKPFVELNTAGGVMVALDPSLGVKVVF